MRRNTGNYRSLVKQAAESSVWCLVHIAVGVEYSRLHTNIACKGWKSLLAHSVTICPCLSSKFCQPATRWLLFVAAAGSTGFT